MNTNKFELTSETVVYSGVTLHRIKALKSFGSVRAGDLGGFVNSLDNLSQDGNSWISNNAKVFGNARVFGNAKVYNNAIVYNNARVRGNAWISGNARIFDNAGVFDDAWVFDDAMVSGYARVSGEARISGNDWVSGNTKVNISKDSDNPDELPSPCFKVGDVVEITDKSNLLCGFKGIVKTIYYNPEDPDNQRYEIESKSFILNVPLASHKDLILILKSCPFCGNDAKVFDEPDPDRNIVSCSLGHAPMRTIEGWQTRS